MRDLICLIGERRLDCVVVDPSAASFIEALKRAGFAVTKAQNEVLSGIRMTAEALKEGHIVICEPCRDAIREFSSYCWDLGEGTRDQVKKEFDHAMDEIRYFVATILCPQRPEGFAAAFVERGVV